MGKNIKDVVLFKTYTIFWWRTLPRSWKLFVLSEKIPLGMEMRLEQQVLSYHLLLLFDMQPMRPLPFSEYPSNLAILFQSKRRRNTCASPSWMQIKYPTVNRVLVTRLGCSWMKFGWSKKPAILPWLNKPWPIEFSRIPVRPQEIHKSVSRPLFRR